MTIDLRLGRWQDVLADVECDALITDPPYSERTHASHSPRTDVLTACERDARWAAKGGKRRKIDYTSWSAEDVSAFVSHWSPRTTGWFVAITDHILAPEWERSLSAAGRYVFAPLQFVAPGSRVRLSGDGPALWSVTIVVARPKTRAFQRWGSLPGAYVLPPGESDKEQGVIGCKPLWLMRALVRDYSRPGSVICDPCSGGATTLVAARLEGRRSVGAEMDELTYRKAMARCSDLPVELAGERQTVLFG